MAIHPKVCPLLWWAVGMPYRTNENVIKKVLGRLKISLVMLQTLVVEIEGILNDRPLTYGMYLLI